MARRAFQLLKPLMRDAPMRKDHVLRFKDGGQALQKGQLFGKAFAQHFEGCAYVVLLIHREAAFAVHFLMQAVPPPPASVQSICDQPAVDLGIIAIDALQSAGVHIAHYRIDRVLLTQLHHIPHGFENFRAFFDEITYNDQNIILAE